MQRFGLGGLFLLVAIVLPIQGSYLLAHRMTHPAHIHASRLEAATPGTVKRSGWASNLVADVLAGHGHAHPTPTNPHGYYHGVVQFHGHDLGDSTVVYLADGVSEDPAVVPSNTRSDPYWPIAPTWFVLPGSRAPISVSLGVAELTIVHQGSGPERPPRA